MRICAKSVRFSMENHYVKWFSVRRGAWSHNVIIFHENARKKLQHHAKLKPHTDDVLAIISTTVDEALLGLTGIQVKTDTNKLYV